MKWFEEHIRGKLGDDGGNRVSGCEDIARAADLVLDDETMFRFVREYFPKQKSLSGFLGVGDSTVVSWMKNISFPDYAKRAVLAAYYSERHLREADAARRDATRPKVVRDGERNMVVRFKEADGDAVAIGSVLEGDIATKNEAVARATSILTLDLLQEHEARLRWEIENVTDSSDKKHLEHLLDALEMDRGRIFHHSQSIDAQNGPVGPMDANVNFGTGTIGNDNFVEENPR